MNDHDNRLRNIETKLRTTRRICLATVTVLFLIIGVGASQSPLVEIVCRSVEVKRDGKTVIAMNDDGTVRIDGGLVINGQDPILKYKEFNVTIQSPKFPGGQADVDFIAGQQRVDSPARRSGRPPGSPDRCCLVDADWEARRRCASLGPLLQQGNHACG